MSGPAAVRPQPFEGGDLATFDALWSALAPIGRDPHTGGYRRIGFSAAVRACEAWFVAEASQRDLVVERDGNGNLLAWWRPEPERVDHGVITGSHLDSVPDGGAYDGALGVASALAAVDVLRQRGVRPARPLGIAVFAEEEGSRFGVACLGSKLMTGAIDPARAVVLHDAEGARLADVVDDGYGQAFGAGRQLGPSLELLRQPIAYVELHIEQGRGLADLGAPIGLASTIWAHGRWRFRFAGEGNHAGTTRMADRRDPMLTYAMTALAANKRARLAEAEAGGDGARATFGRVEVEPNAANAVPTAVTGWLDARAPTTDAVQRLVDDIHRQARDRAVRDGTTLTVTAESVTPAVDFDPGLRHRLAARLAARFGDVPVLATQAGHDAGILATAGVPTAMIFVRNPTGVSHSPAEHAEPDDCRAGVLALADALEELLVR